jgi:GNAT superfamily N-acetyltransferase
VIDLRPAGRDDVGFLREMLYEAAFWRPGTPRPPLDEALAAPALARYLDRFGRPGDTGVVAFDRHDRPVGAAWYRRFSPREPGYGFVDGATPELTIAVRPEARGTGVGGRLLDALVGRAREQGLAGLSLSVADGNPARRLYERHGFEVVAVHEGATTMRRAVAPRPRPAGGGLALSRRLYDDVVAPQLRAAGIDHAACLLGPGSEVLGFDDARSTDHDFGARLQVLTGRVVTLDLPEHFDEWPVMVEVTTPGTLLTRLVGFDPSRPGRPTLDDWLLTPSQRLLEATAGAVHHDGPGTLTAARAALAWYPHDVWLHALACQWRRVAQEEPFAGRAGEAGGDLRSRQLAARVARDLVRLAFLLERRHAPYGKWLGTAFAGLDAAAAVGPLLGRALGAAGWEDRSRALAEAASELARRHDGLGVTEPLDPSPRRFWDRPYLVLDADRYALACERAITDPAVRALPRHRGTIDQWVDGTDALAAYRTWNSQGLT